MKTRIVITGGAGFIGSQLGHTLHQAGWDVVLLDNLSFGHVDNLVVDGRLWGTFVAADIRDANLARRFEGADCVVHLAGIAALPVCQANPQHAFDVNTSGTANVLEAARRAGVRRVIFSSTSAVYERSPGAIHAETDPVQPDLIYAQTKLAAEQICRAYALNNDLDVIVARFFNVYGPHQDFKRKSPPFTSYLAREYVHRRVPVLFNNSREARRDYVHSSDVIALLLKMIQSGERYRADIFNIGSGSAYSVPELVEFMQAMAGAADLQPAYRNPEEYWNAYPELFDSKMPLSRQRVRDEVFKSAIADPKKTERSFDWNAGIDIRAGLKSVYDYARQNASHFG